MIRNGKTKEYAGRMLAAAAAALMLTCCAVGTAFADEEFAVEDDSGSSEEQAQIISGDGTEGSGGSLFEDSNTDIQYKDGISAEGSKKDGKSSRKMIAGYAKVGLIRSITYDAGSKPSEAALQAQFPGTVDVFFAGEKKAVTLKTVWKCVSGDYSSSQSTYYLFSPSFDETRYAVRGMSVTAEAPYIEVRQNPGVAVEMIASAPPTVNEKKIFTYCTEQLGLNGAAACGILANLYCESGFRTNALGDSGTSVGICQWHNGRWTNLRSYTDRWQTLEGQLEYMKWELGHGYSATLNYLKNVTDDAQGAYDAAYFWCMHFEMPDSAHTRGITRGYLAKNIYWPRYGENQDVEDEEGCNASFAGQYVFSGEGNLNIRAEHSEDSAVIGSVPAGASVEVTRANGEWAHVIYDGQSGLCKMEYLTAEEEDPDGKNPDEESSDEKSPNGEEGAGETGSGAETGGETETGAGSAPETEPEADSEAENG